MHWLNTAIVEPRLNASIETSHLSGRVRIVWFLVEL